jgi:hypothetical protein
MNVRARTICRLLIALMLWLPYQSATAGMIATDRTTVLDFFARSDVANELQSLGIDPSTAKDRVAAMSDPEVQALAGRIDSLPAGADGGALLLVILIAAAVWWWLSLR